jgi:hypothetical protein
MEFDEVRNRQICDDLSLQAARAVSQVTLDAPWEHDSLTTDVDAFMGAIASVYDDKITWLRKEMQERSESLYLYRMVVVILVGALALFMFAIAVILNGRS